MPGSWSCLRRCDPDTGTDGWIHATWQDWAVRYLEEMEEDIRRERDLKATDQDKEAA
jgi:hypothetical protein